MGEYFKKVETQGLTFPEFQTPLSHLICSWLGAKPLSFSDLCSRSKPRSPAKSGKEHLTSSHRRPIGRVSGVGADIWEGCLHTAHLLAGGSQHGSLFKESLALLSLSSYSLLLPCLLHCFQPGLLSLSTVPIVSQAASRLIEDHESTETICRLCIIVERI